MLDKRGWIQNRTIRLIQLSPLNCLESHQSLFQIIQMIFKFSVALYPLRISFEAFLPVIWVFPFLNFFWFLILPPAFKRFVYHKKIYVSIQVMPRHLITITLVWVILSKIQLHHVHISNIQVPNTLLYLDLKVLYTVSFFMFVILYFFSSDIIWISSLRWH